MKKNKIGQVKYFTTAKLKEILDESYHRGSTGIDYETVIDEIRDEYYSRMNKLAEKEYKELMERE